MDRAERLAVIFAQFCEYNAGTLGAASREVTPRRHACSAIGQVDINHVLCLRAGGSFDAQLGKAFALSPGMSTYVFDGIYTDARLALTKV